MSTPAGNVQTGARKSAMLRTQAAIPSPDREKNDFYPTPPRGTEALLSVESFDGAIWECACGDGAISHVLQAAGYEVVSTDLVDRGFGQSRIDFLMERHLLAPNIVTNPPFKNADAFAAKALDLGASKVAMLARLSWMASSRGPTFLAKTPLARVHVFSKRLKIWRKGESEPAGVGGMIDFAWYVWEAGYTGKPTLGWL